MFNFSLICDGPKGAQLISIYIGRREPLKGDWGHSKELKSPAVPVGATALIGSNMRKVSIRL